MSGSLYQYDDDFAGISTGYCITTAELNDYVGWSVFSIILIMLAFLDCLAISATIVCMWIETLEKKAYKESKDKPIKLRLTQDYLSKLRPPKKHIPEPAPLERIPKPAPPAINAIDLRSTGD